MSNLQPETLQAFDVVSTYFMIYDLVRPTGFEPVSKDLESPILPLY